MSGAVRELAGRTALVTGGGRGIGAAIVARLARAGADVVVNDLDDGPAKDAVTAAEAHGVRALAHPGNISRRAFAAELVDATLTAFGRLDIVVNNAGYATYAPAVETTDEDFDEVLDVLVAAPFRILRAAGRHFRDTAPPADGERPPARKVVNIASIGGIIGAPGQVAYGVGKAGIIGLTNTLALEWARLNVTVNAVAPGLTRTRLTEGPDIGIPSITVDGREHRLTGGGAAGQSHVPLDDKARMVPVGRIGTPGDIAGAAYFLASPASDFMTGQTMVVDGGMRTGR